MTGGSGFTRLTQATYQVVVQNRKTGALVPGCDLRFGEGNFSRVLDGISQAEWTLPVDECSCDCVPEGRIHELAFYRSDEPTAPAWIGPILRVVDDPAAGTLRFAAQDRLYWAEGAPASRDFFFRAPDEIDAVDLFGQYLDEVWAFEDPNLNRWFNNRVGSNPPLANLLIESGLAKYQSVWSAMLGMAKSSVDFTVVGTDLYWGSPGIPIADGPLLRAVSWSEDPIIDRDSSQVASRVALIGAGGIMGFYPPLDEDTTPQGADGERWLFLADTTLNTQAEVDARAFDVYVANRRRADFVITGDGSLSSTFPPGLRGLIPGRLYPVIANGQCLTADEDVLSLFNVVVEVGSRSTGGGNRELFERRVAADFRRPGSESSAERQSA